MKKIVFIVVVSMLAVAANDSPLLKIAEGLSLIAKEMKPVASLEIEDYSVTLLYNTQKYMVHRTLKTGEHSEKAYEIIGPKYDGLIVEVFLQHGRYEGAAVPHQLIEKPYWKTFFDIYTITKGKQYLHVNISYGIKTDPKSIEKIKDLLVSMIDDDPKATIK